MTVLERLASTPVGRLAGDAVVLPQDSRGEDVIQALCQARQGAALVVDDGYLVGIFTERDVLRRGADGDTGWLALPLAELMTRQPVTVRTDSSISDALRAMRDGQFRHLPIVDEMGKAHGVVSIRDILAEVADYYPQEISNLPPDPSLEARSRYGG